MLASAHMSVRPRPVNVTQLIPRVRGIRANSSSEGVRHAATERDDAVVARAEESAQHARLELKEGASTDLKLIWERLVKLVRPYWVDNPNAAEPRWRLTRLVVFTLMTTGVSVVFNFLGRDFFNALSAKDVDGFYMQLVKYLCGFAVGIPVFVFRDYFMALLSLQWREWMTKDMLKDYMSDGTFYSIHSGQLIDNPDQRLTADINNFTASSLSLTFTFFASITDLVSFSGILFSIYPPLFVALLLYAGGGTAASFWIGKKLVGLNFRQEAREADLRYGLVRVRENAESIAFYDGSRSEVALLTSRIGRVIENYGDLLVASRNLDFFQSAYRYIIILLPAAVVAPLFFSGKIEFGVVNQSQSAFSHILSDVSLIVYQFENLAGFSAVVDRLGQFQEAVEAKGRLRPPSTALTQPVMDPDSEIDLRDTPAASTRGDTGEELLRVEGLTLCTPDAATVLVRNLDLTLKPGQRVIIMGSSGTGKTSILRALAGLWRTGTGSITRPPASALAGGPSPGGVMFVPQKPYMVLGSLRQQLLYPVFEAAIETEVEKEAADSSTNGAGAGALGGLLSMGTSDETAESSANDADKHAAGAHAVTEEKVAPPSDAQLVDALKQVGLEKLLLRCGNGDANAALAMVADWSTLLSLGEQQRLAFARVLLANPALVLLDESTSALDLPNEARLYSLLVQRGSAFVSVGHRASLLQFHEQLLRLEDGGLDADGVAWRIEPVEQAALK